MSREKKMDAQKQARERAERIRAEREAWKAERLHELADIFEKAFTER